MGVATLSGVLLLTPIDADAIRFEGVVGKPVSFSLARRLPAAAGFVLSAAAVTALGSVFGAALAALAVGAGALVLQTLRIGLYRVHSRRAADILFGALLTAGGLVVMTLPPLILPAAPLAVLVGVPSRGGRAMAAGAMIALDRLVVRRGGSAVIREVGLEVG